ncbi:hypothetical protein [Rubellicoccus peritrichatus]|uniref:F5/8 type C domain-containing protein n=1 Tax=Rubellicoccus peritrichatus TaxID=3080537 RepID=A0AAQ3QVI9_9BACT|nr:hypothetical protein [Puniceicoccus sp. CR14]WOO41658.1 hypothetical protein RZN69_01060 [Puniceicoccus sp. CR14]
MLKFSSLIPSIFLLGQLLTAFVHADEAQAKALFDDGSLIVDTHNVDGLEDAVALVIKDTGKLDPARLRIYFETSGRHSQEPQSRADLMMEGGSFYEYPLGAEGWNWERLNAPVIQRGADELIIIVSHPRLSKRFSYFVELTGSDWSVQGRWPEQGAFSVQPRMRRNVMSLPETKPVDLQPLLDFRPPSLSIMLRDGPKLESWNSVKATGFQVADSFLASAGIDSAHLFFKIHDAATGAVQTAVPQQAWQRDNGFAWKGNTLGVEWYLVADIPRDGEVRITGWLHDDSERFLSAEVGLNRSLEGFMWADDVSEKRQIDTSEELVGNFSASRYGANRRQSYYPFAVVENENEAFVIETDPGEPRVFYLAATPDSLKAVYEMSLTPDTKQFPGQATFRCSLYSVALQGKPGFRAVLEAFYQRYPDYNERRVPRSGLWMPFSDISQLPEPEDFGFVFFEKGGPRGADVDYAEENDILTLMYTEPWLYWLPFNDSEERTPEQALAKMLLAAGLTDSWARDLAASGLAGASQDEQGDIMMKFMDLPWNRGARMEVNTDLDLEAVLPFKMNRAMAEWKQMSEFLSDPRVDGIYLDSMDAAVMPDFNKRALAATDYPTTYSMDVLRPVIAPNVPQYEFTAALGAYLRSEDKYLMGNFPVTDSPFVNRWIDIPGQETDWFSGGQYHPPSRAKLNYRRAMSGQKPFGFLQSTNFSEFSGEPLRRYFETCLLYGFQPSFFSHNAADDPYWLDHELLERDRHLFRTFVPLIQRTSDAGWQAVQDVDLSDNELIQVEQFGDSSDGIWYLVLQNLSENRQQIAITMPSGLGQMLMVQPLSGQVDWVEGGEPVSLILEDHQTVLVDYVSPESIDEEQRFLDAWKSGYGEAEAVRASFASILREQALGVQASVRLVGIPVISEPTRWDLTVSNSSGDVLTLKSDDQVRQIDTGAMETIQVVLPPSDGIQEITWQLLNGDGVVEAFSRSIQTLSIPPVEVSGFESRFLTRTSEARVPFEISNLSDKPRTCQIEWEAGDLVGQNELTISPGSNELVTLAVPSYGQSSVSLKVRILSDESVLWESNCRIVFLDANASLAIESGVKVFTDSTFGGYSTEPLHDGVADTENVAWNQASWASAETDTDHWVEIQFPTPTEAKELVIHWNSEAGITYTGRRGRLVGTSESGEVLELGDWDAVSGDSKTRITFDPQEFKSLRVVQDAQHGPIERPDIMWVSEVAVY